MSISARFYIFPNNSLPLKVSKRLATGLARGEDSIPSFADTRQRALEVIIELEHSKPSRIVGVHGMYWRFDAVGRIDVGLRRALVNRLIAKELMEPTDEKVVALQPRIERQRLLDDIDWTPDKGELDIIADDIWPRPGALSLGSVKGTKKKRPPRTYDSQAAMREATEGFWKIHSVIHGLKEPSLKSFIFDAWEATEDKQLSPELYEALARMAERRLEILKRRRSSKGFWYASVEVMRWNDENEGQVVTVFSEKCNGKQNAVLAARRLIAEHADEFSADTTLEAHIVSDLEWERPE